MPQREVQQADADYLGSRIVEQLESVLTSVERNRIRQLEIADTDVAEIKDPAAAGLLDGVTTNPGQSIL